MYRAKQASHESWNSVALCISDLQEMADAENEDAVYTTRHRKSVGSADALASCEFWIRLSFSLLSSR